MTQIQIPFTFTQFLTGIYFVAFGALVIMSVFVVYHILRYAYSKASALLMLVIFLPTTIALLVINKALFNASEIIETIQSLLDYHV